MISYKGRERRGTKKNHNTILSAQKGMGQGSNKINIPKHWQIFFLGIQSFYLVIKKLMHEHTKSSTKQIFSRYSKMFLLDIKSKIELIVL